jgi:hypothetical protein
MTSRTTPVGVLVLAAASLAAVGCSPQTSAAFEALLQPALVPPSPVAALAPPTVSPDAVPTELWWPLPEGYAMVLPGDWTGAAVDEVGATQLMAALAASDPLLAERIETVLGATNTRVSAVAVGTMPLGSVGPMLLVLVQPTEDRGAHAVKTLVKDQISMLPGLTAPPVRIDVTLPAVKGVRFDFSIEDPDLGPLQVRSYLFRFASEAYLVTFVASTATFAEAEPIFDAIAASLRFGV